MKNILFSLLLFVESVVVTYPSHALNDLEQLEIKSVLEEHQKGRSSFSDEEIEFLQSMSQEVKAIIESPLWKETFKGQWEKFIGMNLKNELKGLTFAQLSFFMKALIDTLKKNPQPNEEEWKNIFTHLDAEKAPLLASALIKIFEHFKNEITEQVQAFISLTKQIQQVEHKQKDLIANKLSGEEQLKSIGISGAAGGAVPLIASTATSVGNCLVGVAECAPRCAPCALGTFISGVATIVFFIVAIVFIFIGAFASLSVLSAESFPCTKPGQYINNFGSYCLQLQPTGFSSNAINCSQIAVNDTLPFVNTTLLQFGKSFGQLLGVNCSGTNNYSFSLLYQSLVNGTNSCFNATGSCVGFFAGYPDEVMDPAALDLWASIYFPIVFGPAVLAVCCCLTFCGCASMLVFNLVSSLAFTIFRQLSCICPPCINSTITGALSGLTCGCLENKATKLYDRLKMKRLINEKAELNQTRLEVQNGQFVEQGLASEFLSSEENAALSDFFNKFSSLNLVLEKSLLGLPKDEP